MPGICLPGVTKMKPLSFAERIVGRRELAGELIGGIDEGVVGIDEPVSASGTRRQPRAPGGACPGRSGIRRGPGIWLATLMMSFCAVGTEQAELPIERPAGGVRCCRAGRPRACARPPVAAADRRPGSPSIRHGRCGIGAAELERRRRAVGFRITGIEGHQLRRDLVGEARTPD